MPDFLAPINLNKNEMQNMRLQNLASAPENPVEGQVYHNTTDHKTYAYNGTSWVEMGGGGTGDMTKAVYDTDDDGRVDKAESVDDGTNSSSAADVKDAVDKKHTQGTDTTLGIMTADINMDSHQVTALSAPDASGEAIRQTTKITEANLEDAVDKKHTQNTDTGTTSGTFQLDSGNSGPKFKNNAGEVQLRNAADDEYADLRVKNLKVDGTTTIVDSETVTLADNILELNSNITAHGQNDDGGIAVKRFQDNDTDRADAEMYFDNTNGVWKVKDGATDDLQTHQVARKYSVAIGNGADTSLVVTHNLNTRDVTVTVRETGSPYAVVFPDIEMTSVDTITVKFATAPTSNQYTVVVVG